MGKLVIAKVRVEPKIDLGKLLRKLPVGVGPGLPKSCSSSRRCTDRNATGTFRVWNEFGLLFCPASVKEIRYAFTWDPCSLTGSANDCPVLYGRDAARNFE